MSDTDDEYLNVETEAEDATGPAVASVLGSIAGSLREAPVGKRFDMELVVHERNGGGDGDR